MHRSRLRNKTRLRFQVLTCSGLPAQKVPAIAHTRLSRAPIACRACLVVLVASLLSALDATLLLSPGMITREKPPLLPVFLPVWKIHTGLLSQGPPNLGMTRCCYVLLKFVYFPHARAHP